MKFVIAAASVCLAFVFLVLALSAHDLIYMGIAIFFAALFAISSYWK
jgi:hypothetical protein